MGSIFIIQGILIYIYAFDHNPPHIHVKCGGDEFTMTIKDRVVEGKAKAKTIQTINNFLDEHEAEVIIGSPDLLLELAEEKRVDFSKINILVVDDINLIKKNKQIANMEKILEMLPAEKQNIVYTNRRSRETKDILDKILKSPQEIKVDKNKECEAKSAPVSNIKNASCDIVDSFLSHNTHRTNIR